MGESRPTYNSELAITVSESAHLQNLPCVSNLGSVTNKKSCSLFHALSVSSCSHASIGATLSARSLASCIFPFIALSLRGWVVLLS